MLTLKRCTTTASDKRHDVVDGQQRLTTLTLVLAAVKHRVTLPETKGALARPLFARCRCLSDCERRAASLETYLRQTANAMAGTSAGPRIRVWQQAAPAFDAILRADAPINWRDEANSALLSYGPAIRMKENLETIQEFFDERDAELVEQMAKYILFRCEFAVSTTSDQSLAVQVFRSQTGRGKDLQPSDILKAELVAVLPAAEGDAFAQRWQDMEALLGREELQTFLLDLAKMAARVSLADTSPGHAFSTLSTLTEKLKKNEGGLRGFALQYLPAALGAYRTATCAEPFESKPSASQADADVNAALLALNYSGLDKLAHEWVPLAMRALMLHSSTPVALAKMLKDLERTSAYLTLCVSNAKAREKRYADALAELEEPGRSAAPLSKLELSAQEMADMRAVCEHEQLYKKTKSVRTVLLRLDLALRESKGSVRALIHPAASITIEHVLPQSELAVGSDWLRDFPDAAERERLTHALGNLVLLSGRKNSKAANLEFKEKLETYFRNRDKTSSISEFALTQHVHQYKTWTPAVLRKRQSELLKVLYGPQGWDLQQ